MDLALLGSLAVLALVDSTSFGTLLIPIWLLLTPGPVRASRVMVFLGTVAAFYFAVGLALAAGADAVAPRLGSLLDTRPVVWGQLGLGVALVVVSFRIDGKKPAAQGGDAPAPGGRLDRWRERAMGSGGGTAQSHQAGGRGPAGFGGLVGLALTAAIVEVGTMLPYLAAIGLVTAAALPAAQVALVMAGYCLLMVVPALALLGLRLAAGPRIEPVLRRVSRALSSSNALAWIVGIVGFLIASDAVERLFQN